jgi:threonine aldolase
MIDKFSTDFASDNAAQVHSAVFEAMVKANQGSALAYGSDSVTEAMNELFKTTFTENIVARLVCTGTGANSVALATMALPHQAILCAKSAHINEDECGAPESLSGAKLIGLETIQGKTQIRRLPKALFLPDFLLYPVW